MQIVYAILIFLMMTACQTERQPVGSKEGIRTLVGKDYAPGEGADTYTRWSTHPNSTYYGNPDYYSLKPDGNLSIISHFTTMQQTTEWSCGDVCALLLLYHFGCADHLTEWDLAVALNSMTDRNNPGAKPGTAREYADYGTRIEELYSYFNRHPQLKVVASSYRATYTDAELVKPADPYPRCDCGNLYPTFNTITSFSSWLTTQLCSNRPVMVEWSDWDGHWVLIIGIDNNGTPDFTGDDTLIFADPYDTSDHRQDGYSVAPLERFFCSWKDRAIAPKPYQLQPFVVVDRR